MVLRALGLVVLAACAAPTPTRAPTLELRSTDGRPTALPGDLARSKLTVVIFYSEHCPCFRVHESRIRDLARTYAAQGVAFLLVDSEVGETLERDAESAKTRDLPPITLDPDAKLADALGAKYATFSVILDSSGAVRYRGGIDSDKNRLTEHPSEWLREALDDLLAGREPRLKEGKALGCALQTR